MNGKWTDWDTNATFAVKADENGTKQGSYEEWWNNPQHIVKSMSKNYCNNDGSRLAERYFWYVIPNSANTTDGNLTLPETVEFDDDSNNSYLVENWVSSSWNNYK